MRESTRERIRENVQPFKKRSRSIAMTQKDNERVERLKELTLLQNDSKAIRAALRFALYHIKAFQKFVSSQEDI